MNRRIFFPSCPARFGPLMEEFLFRTDPANTACKENECYDEYTSFVDTLGGFLESSDGVMTEEDWNGIAGDWFTSETIAYPFGEDNRALIAAFFPDAFVEF